MIRWIAAASLLSIALTASSCTKKSTEPGEAAPEAQKAEGVSNTVVLSAVGETMAYDQATLTVKAGQSVTLTFKNPSTTQRHNWVLTKPGKENDVALAGIQAGDAKGFIPDSPEILSHTKLLAPGESDTVTFTAPPAGDYPYVCTFPGHHVMMRGTLKSVP